MHLLTIYSFTDVEQLMSVRQAAFSSIAQRQHLRDLTKIDVKAARLNEARALIGVCELARSHKVLQHALSAATHLNNVMRLCKDVGLNISAATTLQTANVLWAQGETVSSISMLQDLKGSKTGLENQDIIVSPAELLTTLVRHYLNIIFYVKILTST